MRHKHYDCIVAWASGEKIETRETFCHEWREIENPSWYIGNEYRIKKEPVIEVKYFIYDKAKHSAYVEVFTEPLVYDLKITYQDGKAIKAEVAE